MIETEFFEAIVSNYLWAAGDRWRVERRPSGFDYLVEPSAGKRVALVVRSSPPRGATFEALRKKVTGQQKTLTEFALVKNLSAYAEALAGTRPDVRSHRGGQKSVRATPRLPQSYAGPVRQLPFRVIQRLRDDPGELDAKLRFGQRIPSVTVLLSNLKNFSSLVTASEAELRWCLDRVDDVLSAAPHASTSVSMAVGASKLMGHESQSRG
jgi:hypothetical protein